MKTGRDDYDAMIRITSIPDGEPVFIVRAHDPAAGSIIDLWVAEHQARGAPKAVLESALRRADAITAWPVKKDHADADHIAEGEQLRLAHAFDRRTWNWGELTATGRARQHGVLQGVAWVVASMVEAGLSVGAAAWLKAEKIKVDALVGAGLGEDDAAVLRILMQEMAA